jgi:cytochrome c2
MLNVQMVILCIASITLGGCASEQGAGGDDTGDSGASGGSGNGGGPILPVDPADVTPGTMPMGMMVYLEPTEGGNTFACETCHALQEPAADGVRRVGHEIGSATARAHWKNGRLNSLLKAVNTCRQEWMNASPWDEDNPSWSALFEWLETSAPAEATPVNILVAVVPSELGGGDAAAGEMLFNESCSMCHGQGAIGTVRAPQLAGVGLEGALIARRVRTSGRAESPTYAGLTGGIMPFWGADRLADDELRNIIAFLIASEMPMVDPEVDPEPDPEPGPTGCGQTHPKIGQIAELQNRFHGVGGTAVVVDDCTIRIDSFDFDGNGINIQVYGATNGNYGDGFSLSDNLKNFPVGYEDATLTLTIPDGRTLDDLDGISVWCVPVGVSFGDGLFAAP